MMPASNQGMGMNFGFPDVCLTPTPAGPVPIPYPNLGMNAMSMPFTPNVVISGMPGHNMAAKPLMTNGDNAGVAHPMCMMPGGCTMGNPIVQMNALPSEHLLSPSYGNNFNKPVGAKLVPSVTNVLVTCATPAPLLAEQLLSPTSRPDLEARLEGRVATLELRRFGLRSGLEAREAWRRLRQRGARRLRIDLRANPGGALGAALELAAAFLPAGANLGRIAGGVEASFSAGSAGDTHTPLTLLVDGGTASAAEVLAAALSERAEVEGPASAGKLWGRRLGGGPRFDYTAEDRHGH